MTPQRLGSRYLLHEQIGQGGMGVVWRAEDVEAGTWRAVKLLRPEYARDPGAVARFVRERNALLALRHPSVVTLHDMIVEGERLALVMDLLTEGDLDRFRRGLGGSLSPGLAAELVAQVCDGLSAAHAAGIVHRDLKPGNVLMDRGRARLTDFGIARIGGESSVTTPGTVAGTVSYMAPEALAGAGPAPACDVYAAGVTLYELAAGRPPFTGQPAMVIYGHLHTVPARPDGLPGPLWQLVAACLAKDPAARPAAAQLAAALRAPQLAAALGGPQLPGDEPPAPPAGPWQRETADAAGRDAGPHTIAGIGWLSPAGPVPRGPVPPAPVPPRAAEEPASRKSSGKRRWTWGIAAAAALVVVGAGAGALAAYMPGSAVTPEANSVTAAPVTGQASPAATTRSSSPGKTAPPSSSDPASPASSPSAAVPPADTPGSGSPSASATSASPTPATTTASPTPTPSATKTTSTLSGKKVTHLEVDEVYPATKGNNGAVQVSWDQVVGATSYTVYMEVKGSFSTDRTLANEGGLAAGPHEIKITPEPGGAGLSVSFTVPK
jgi:serine/threonine protein kinase, bacterial